ncbi:hypothetical protein WJ0W_004887 [Paenibacillus melissococcoides]|uniref:Uncharacterized protein n=1 Tax=Paenibacillus melissococcoides TaxID=2912268 RepID=A0ABN8U928_9BACL|nr:MULTISPECIES: hypothetical protein [Paenibacillus]MEB9892877.1 hypothetical protein [Bacillus cereus]CAH8247634.1 hypothetical protein WJ0W_004887 [Paenibacillus melissococcoides]CAH8705511.1 hypothetical protein HTL2_000970 [Paenibacillus melissococcoides]CAH8714982.1 hypothetical protein WDD9_004090 [Paenibacillus melissococcoides]
MTEWQIHRIHFSIATIFVTRRDGYDMFLRYSVSFPLISERRASPELQKNDNRSLAPRPAYTGRALARAGLSDFSRPAQLVSEIFLDGTPFSDKLFPAPSL